MIQIEEDYFKNELNDFDFERDIIFTFKSCKIGNKVYQSEMYKPKGMKKFNYAVQFISKSGYKQFGLIKYFIRIGDLSFVAIHDLQVSHYISENILGRLTKKNQALKNLGVFNRFFFHIEESDSVSFILTSQLFCKCIYIQNEHDSFITEFITENEHD